VGVFHDLLPLMSLDYDHLSVLGDFSINILCDPGCPISRIYCYILDSLSISYFPMPFVIRRPVYGTFIKHVLKKFPEKVASFSTRFSPALSDHSF
jgi:hypothetical protein